MRSAGLTLTIRSRLLAVTNYRTINMTLDTHMASWLPLGSAGRRCHYTQYETFVKLLSTAGRMRLLNVTGGGLLRGDTDAGGCAFVLSPHRERPQLST